MSELARRAVTVQSCKKRPLASQACHKLALICYKSCSGLWQRLWKRHRCVSWRANIRHRMYREYWCPRRCWKMFAIDVRVFVIDRVLFRLSEFDSIFKIIRCTLTWVANRYDSNFVQRSVREGQFVKVNSWRSVGWYNNYIRCMT